MILASVVLLAACQTKRERAADAYEQAVALMKQGDTARVRVAFLNVFKNDPSHVVARAHYATYMRETGNVTEAAGQFLRLLEQQPDHLPTLIAMAELTMEQYEWALAKGHLDRAARLASEDPTVAALQSVLAYARSGTDDDPAPRHLAVRQMERAAEDTRLLVLARALVDARLRDGDGEGALSMVDESLQRWPNDMRLHSVKLLVLQSLGRTDAVDSQYRAMIDAFPETRSIASRYVQWLSQTDRRTAAESFLRARVQDGDVADNLELARFLMKIKGPEAVLADLDALVERDLDPLLFRAMRATTLFQLGQQGDAIDEMSDIVNDSAGDTADRDRYRIVLAEMLEATGQRNRAETVITAVIRDRPNLPAAAALQARFLLDMGRYSDGISTLRAALDAQSPDPDLLLLMARLHALSGSTDQATRALSLAFDASGARPDVALDFAVHLEGTGHRQSAIDVLQRARSANPAEIALLTALGELHVKRADWPRTLSIAAALRALETGGEIAELAAQRLQFAALAASQPVDAALTMIESGDGDSSAFAYLALVRAYLAADKPDAALRMLDQGIARAPENQVLRAVSAQLALSQGDAARAAAIYHDLLDEVPESEQIWLGLRDAVAAKQGDGPSGATLEVIDRALKALPQSLRLQWERAILLDRLGRADDAILAYQTILDRDPRRLPALNNLARLLSVARTDEDSLARAAEMIDPLERSDIPNFKNTVGWIRYRTGQVGAAVELLVPAAAALPEDALAQLQAGEALLALGLADRATTFLERARTLATDDPDILARAEAGLAEIGTDPGAGNKLAQ